MGKGRYETNSVTHLGRRDGGTWSEGTSSGWFTLGSDRATVTAGDDLLLLRVEADPARVPELEDAVGRHLVRFAAKAGLRVTWRRANGDPGTEQHLTE